MRAVLALGASLMLVAPACADPGWYAEDGPLGTYANNNQNIALEVWCGEPNLPPIQVDYTDYDSDDARLPDDITAGTLVIAAGKAKAQRFAAKFDGDNDSFSLSGVGAVAVIELALKGQGLSAYVDIKGRHYIRASFDNTGMDKAAPALMACLKQLETAQ
jgi:hypothetical protein